MEPKTYFDDSYIESLDTDGHNSQRVTNTEQEPVNCTQPMTTSPTPRRPSRSTERPAWMTNYVTTATTSDATSKVIYLVANQVSHTHLNPTHQAFLTALDQ